MSLTWNYTLTADEQTASNSFFKVTWKKFNLGTSSFDELAFYLKFAGSSPFFNEPNAPRIVIDRSTGTSSATLQFMDVRLEDERIYKIEVSVTFPGTVIIVAQEFNVTVKGRGTLQLTFNSVRFKSVTGSFRAEFRGGCRPAPPLPP